jgi:hypothetical protein
MGLILGKDGIFLFASMYMSALGPTQPPVQRVPVSFDEHGLFGLFMFL